MEKTSSGKTGPCINCGRTKYIADKVGHCSRCHYAVKDLEIGSDAYISALESVKANLTKSNIGRAPRARRNEKQSAKKVAAKSKSTLDMTIKEVARTGIPGIIQCMRNEQAGYLSEAEKLGKAIKILQSL